MIMTHEPAITRITIFFCISCYSSWSYFINGSNLFLKSPIFQPHVHLGSRGGGELEPIPAHSLRDTRYTLDKLTVHCSSFQHSLVFFSFIIFILL